MLRSGERDIRSTGPGTEGVKPMRAFLGCIFMTAVSMAGLTIYDMCKAVDREMTIGEIRLVKKSGGKSGTFIRKE